MAMNNWMADLKDGINLTQMIMPGSHDAGIYEGGSNTVGIAKANWAICQYFSIKGQCEAGSRLYDIRITGTDGTLRAYHTASDSRGCIASGCLGEKAVDILNDVAEFVTENKTEFVILRFSHTHAKTGIVELIKQKIGNVLYKNLESKNLASINIDYFRGKVICIFDTADFGNQINSGQGIHAFNKKLGAKEGLSICGEYSNEHRDSAVWVQQLANQAKHVEHSRDCFPTNNHLFQLYFTQSGSVLRRILDVKKMTLGQITPDDRGTHFHMQEKMNELTLNLAKYSTPNIILYDFVNATSSEQICNLNEHLKAYKVVEA